jgi:hypothetical protein
MRCDSEFSCQRDDDQGRVVLEVPVGGYFPAQELIRLIAGPKTPLPLVLAKRGSNQVSGIVKSQRLGD